MKDLKSQSFFRNGPTLSGNMKSKNLLSSILGEGDFFHNLLKEEQEMGNG